MSRPDALTSRLMSSESLVRIMAFWRRATVTTTASTTSTVLVMPSSRPASAPHSRQRHDHAPSQETPELGLLRDRLTWATTGAGTKGITPSSKRTLCTAHARRSFRSAATRIAASQTTVPTPNGDQSRTFGAARERCRELHSSRPRRGCRAVSHSSTAANPARRCSASRARDSHPG